MSELNQVRGIIGGTVSIGRFVVNDYTLTISEIEDGYRLTIQRGSETQSADLQSLAPEDIATIREAEQGRVDAEALRVLAENARASAEEARQAGYEAVTQAAEEATEKANAIGNKLSTVAVDVAMLNPTDSPTAEVAQTKESTTIHLGIPQSRLAYATFDVDPETMELQMHDPDRFADVAFELNNGNLEVEI